MTPDGEARRGVMSPAIASQEIELGATFHGERTGVRVSVRTPSDRTYFVPCCCKSNRSHRGMPMMPNRSTRARTQEVPVFTRIALERALVSGLCLICTAVRASERKSIHAFLYEGMMSPGVRQDFLRKGGFCRRHFWMAKRIEEDSWQAGGIGLAILCEGLLRLASDSFVPNANAPRSRKRTIMRRTEPPTISIGSPCVFCEENTARESYLIEILEKLLGEAQFQPVARGELPCVAHARIAATNWRSEHNRTSVSSAVRSQLQLLAGEIRTFIDKHDYQNRNELRDEQRDVLQRAIQVLVGSDHRFGRSEDRS